MPVENNENSAKVEFYANTNILLLAAVCLLIAYDGRPGIRNIETVRKIINLNSIIIMRDSIKKPGVEWLFDDYKKRCGEDNPVIGAFKIYKTFKERSEEDGKEKANEKILIEANKALQTEGSTIPASDYEIDISDILHDCKEPKYRLRDAVILRERLRRPLTAAELEQFRKD